MTDLTILRVKDFDLLPGPKGVPRIYEVLKAATILVTTTTAVGLDIEDRALAQNLSVFSQATTGGTSTLIMDGKDLFFAVKIVAVEARNRPIGKLELGRAARPINVGPYRATIARSTLVAGASACEAKFTVAWSRRGRNEGVAIEPETVDLKKGRAEVSLPAPYIASGALYRKLELTADRTPDDSCADDRLSVSLLGAAQMEFRHPHAPGW